MKANINVHVDPTQLANCTIDLFIMIVLKDVKEIWVTLEEKHTSIGSTTTGNTKLFIEQFDDLEDHEFIFKRADDAISLAKEIISVM